MRSVEANGAHMLKTYRAVARGRRIRQRPYVRRWGWKLRKVWPLKFYVPKSSGLWKATQII